MILINDVPSMDALAGRIAQTCSNSLCVYLKGELGTGKTTLVRGILRSLGYVGSVKSPTYTLVEPYEVNGKKIYHFDLYRLTDAEELEAIGIRDYWDEEALIFIEWPEMGQGVIPEPDVLIYLQHETQGRKISFESSSLQGQAIIDSLNL